MISSMRDRDRVNHFPTTGSGSSTPLTTPLRSPMGTPGPETQEAKKEGNRRIQLDQVYAYRSLDKVSGSVNHSGALADRIKVHLTGTSYISHQRFLNGSYRMVEKSWEFLKLTQKLSLVADSSTTTVFSFRLPEALLESSCPLRNALHLLLPPTLGCKRDDGLDDLTPKDATSTRIEYCIIVELSFEGQPVQSWRKPFRVAPRHFATPHTMNPPPGYDEIVHVEEDVHRSVGGKIGVFKLTCQQPPALLSSLEEHQLTTMVRLTVEFHSITSPPPKIQGIGVKIRAITRSRVEHLLEGQEDLSRHADLRLNKVVFSKNTAPTWRPSRPGVWSTDLEVPVTLCPKGYVAIPEFESCLIDRHYRLTLKFELSPTAGLPLAETRLTIPTWIMADEYYGLPEKGHPVKFNARFLPPKDIGDDPVGSLPVYEDTYLSNLAENEALPPVVVGDQGTRAAPFSLSGREPDYFARPRATYPPRAGPSRTSDIGGSGAAGAHGRRRQQQQQDDATIEGVELTDAEEERNEATRVPAWMAKELEAPDSAGVDPRHQDGAQ